MKTTTAAKAAPRRRTQSERRATTVAALIDATIETMREVGYSRTTVKEICARAELSHGALFRFFPTLLDLILAAAEEIGQRQIREFERSFAAQKDGGDPVYRSLLLLRKSCRSPTNAVFYELLVAARTDDTLRAAMKPGVDRYIAAIRASAQKAQLLPGLPPDLFDTLLFTAIHLFDGETLVRKVYPQPEQEERRMQLLKLVLASLGAA
jgi:AcrR family transcriptional regulator